MVRGPVIRDNTPREESALKRRIADDPDTWEAPEDMPVTRRGRPAGKTKAQKTVRLDLDLIKALQTPESKGWQTRLNAAAWAGLKTVGKD